MGKVKLFFAGDFCSTPSTSFITVSEDLQRLIKSCNVAVVNFEVPLKPENVLLPPQKNKRFFQHDDVPQFLRNMGFSLFPIANNHLFDWDEKGYEKTIAALGEGCFGAGSYEEAYRVKVVEAEGLKIGFMALSYAAYKGVFDDVTNQEGLGCAYINDLRVNHDIIEAKKHVDYLFILPHDGIEYIDIPMPETIARYRDFIDYGADGVIAAHPHCPQGWEEYKGKVIFYSLGNFLFNSKENYDFYTSKLHWYEGLCVVMSIENDSIKWRVVNTRNVDNAGVEIDYNEDRNRHNDQLCQYLTDHEQYTHYFTMACKKYGQTKEMKIIEKSVLRYWLGKIKRNNTIDKELKFLLKHDQRRNILLHSI